MQNRIFFPFLSMLLLCASFAVSATGHAAPPVDFRGLVKSAMPAVVNISTERTEDVRPPQNPFDFFRGHPDLDRFFEPFDNFYNDLPRSRTTRSLGSGFIISPDGYVVTNNHVIEGATVIRVNIGNNKKDDLYTAEVVGTDPETDLALLKIKANNLPSLSFGNSNLLEVGEWVVAIGSPLGLDHTVTAGIVSAKSRNIQSGSYDDFLQTDASINRGNSGGPLLNMDGEVIGINTAIAQRAQGIGFAIPSTLAQRIITALKDHKKVSRGWLGVTIQNVDSATAKALGMKEAEGALIGSIFEGQPAALAGIKEGDVILSINGEAVADTEQLLRMVALLSPGSKASIIVWRDGTKKTMTLTVAERDLSQAENGKESKGGAPSTADNILGLKTRPVTPDDIRRYDLGNVTAGLLIISVSPNSPAAETGIRSGDVLLAVNRQPVTSVKDFGEKVLAAQKQRGAVLLHLSRKGQVFFRAIEFPEK